MADIEPLLRNYDLARALVDALPADVGLTPAQFEAAAGHLLSRGYRHVATLACDVVTEHAIEMSGGSMQIRADYDGRERVYPLAQWIPDHQRDGGKVYKRRVIVVDDWTEVPHG